MSWSAEEHPDLADRKRRKLDEEVEGVGSIFPMDVLLLIFARLTAVDLIRSRAVCVSWRSAVETMMALQSPLRTIRPWLMRFQDSNNLCSRFVDTSTGETYIIHLPELHQKRLVGKSDNGFLVYEDEISKSLSMINPITRATICFPPLPCLLDGAYRVSVISSSSPSCGEEGTTGAGYTAIIFRPGRWEIFSAFADARNLSTWGKLSWILFNVKQLHICGKKLYGFFRRSHLGVDDCLQLFTCDLHVPTDFKVWPFKFYCYPWSLSDFGSSLPVHRKDKKCTSDCLRLCCLAIYYPVVLPNGDLIVVCRASVSYPRTAFVKLYKMPTDLQGETEIITSIGDCALFLDEHRSIALSTLDFPELKPNTIYFSNDCHVVIYPETGHYLVKGLVMFDLEAQHLVEYYPNSTVFSDRVWSTWFIPSF